MADKLTIFSIFLRAGKELGRGMMLFYNYWRNDGDEIRAGATAIYGDEELVCVISNGWGKYISREGE